MRELAKSGGSFYEECTPTEQPSDAIRSKLLHWYQATARDLPWRRTSDPYCIWISEIMLQQTRVVTALPYYERFIERFPNLGALARAEDDELLAAWSGLGYYSRARNLKKAAQMMDGRFPSTYDGIRSLPGVGQYTAAAVGSIAFGLPHAAVDGNVLRVLARVVNAGGDIGDVPTRERLAGVADRLLDRSRPGIFNQAVMELGATVCLPQNPLCLSCPIATECIARAEGRQNELPVKRRRVEPVHIERTVCVIRRGDEVLLWRRPEGERLMAGFWDIPELTQLPGATMSCAIGSFRHSITHHIYVFQVVLARIKRRPEGYAWVALAQMNTLPVTTIARKALRLLVTKPGQS